MNDNVKEILKQIISKCPYVNGVCKYCGMKSYTKLHTHECFYLKAFKVFDTYSDRENIETQDWKFWMNYNTKKENINMNDYEKLEKLFCKEFLFEQVVNVDELHLAPKKQKTVVTKAEIVDGKTILCKYEIGQYHTPTRYFLKCVAILDKFDQEWPTNNEFSIDNIMKFERG